MVQRVNVLRIVASVGASGALRSTLMTFLGLSGLLAPLSLGDVSLPSDVPSPTVVLPELGGGGSVRGHGLPVVAFFFPDPSQPACPSGSIIVAGLARAYRKRFMLSGFWAPPMTESSWVKAPMPG